MASYSSVLSEDHLQCSMCLNVFTDPVSTPCGHNFCMICIKECWDTSSACQCPVCKTSFPRKPELRVNTLMSGLATTFKESVQETSSCPPKRARPSVLCDICSEDKHEALKSCLICVASYCRTHLEPHDRLSSLNKHKLIDPVENPEDYICQKHEQPLEMFCRGDQTCICQFCTLVDHKNHNTVPIEEESGLKKTECKNKQEEVEQMIQHRLKKIEEIKHSVEDNKRNTEKEKADSMEIFRFLICSIERIQAETLKRMEEKQRAGELQAEEFIKDLEQEITELKRRNTELEEISNTEDHLHVLQMYSYLCTFPPTNIWIDVRIQTHLDVETLRGVWSQLKECVDVGIKKFKLKRIQQYAVDVILDPDTAHPKLILSEDGKQVTYGDTRQNLPDNPERFDLCPCVLGKEGFSSGRFYYEVQVKGKTDWDLGVIRESSDRKGQITASPENGYWSVWLRNKTHFKALDFPSAPLSLKRAPQKVGVFVDYEEGLVSFYDVENESHIYSFTDQSFSEKLYPVISPSLNYKGKNSAPLIICPVTQVLS